jgi:hypothetical protein
MHTRAFQPFEDWPLEDCKESPSVKTLITILQAAKYLESLDARGMKMLNQDDWRKVCELNPMNKLTKFSTVNCDYCVGPPLTKESILTTLRSPGKILPHVTCLQW